MALSLLHTHGKNVPRRVRVVMDWIIESLATRGSERP